MENSVQNQVRIICVYSHAAWISQRSSHIPEMVQLDAKSILDIRCLVYLEDILINSDNLTQHKQDVRKIMKTIQHQE